MVGAAIRVRREIGIWEDSEPAITPCWDAICDGSVCAHGCRAGPTLKCVLVPGWGRGQAFLEVFNAEYTGLVVVAADEERIVDVLAGLRAVGIVAENERVVNGGYERLRT